MSNCFWSPLPPHYFSFLLPLPSTQLLLFPLRYHWLFSFALPRQQLLLIMLPYQCLISFLLPYQQLFRIPFPCQYLFFYFRFPKSSFICHFLWTVIFSVILQLSKLLMPLTVAIFFRHHLIDGFFPIPFDPYISNKFGSSSYCIVNWLLILFPFPCNWLFLPPIALPTFNMNSNGSAPFSFAISVFRHFSDSRATGIHFRCLFRDCWFHFFIFSFIHIFN